MTAATSTALRLAAGLQLVEADGVVLAVVDDGKVNAIDLPCATGLRRAVSVAVEAGNPLVIAGRPGVLSAGFDLAVVRGEDRRALLDLLEETKQLLVDILAARVPVVFACTGHALAAGALLLMSGDLRIGPLTEAKIAMNEVAVGLVTPEAALTLAHARLSRRHLHAATVLGKTWTPEEAVAVGLLDELADDPIEAALCAARELGALDPRAFGETKKLATAGLIARLRTQSLATPEPVVAHPVGITTHPGQESTP